MRITTGMGAVLAAMAVVACGPAEPVGPVGGATATVLADATGNTVVAAVTGSAHTYQAVGTSVVLRRLTFEVTRREDGRVDGTWQLVAGASIIGGSLTCFTVGSDGAVRVGGTVDHALFTTFQEGTDTGWYLEDNGEGADPDDRSGRLIYNATPGTAQQFCDGTYTDPRAEEIVELRGGNVQVH